MDVLVLISVAGVSFRISAVRQTFQTERFIRKQCSQDCQTRWSKWFSQLINLPGAQSLMKPQVLVDLISEGWITERG